jgi:hypothetical protein
MSSNRYTNPFLAASPERDMRKQGTYDLSTPLRQNHQVVDPTSPNVDLRQYGIVGVDTPAPQTPHAPSKGPRNRGVELPPLNPFPDSPLKPTFYLGPPDSKTVMREQLRGYINNLYSIMSKHGGCFYSGSFVIDDFNGKLKKILTGAKSDELREIMHSHKSLGPIKNPDICSKGICEVHFSQDPLEISCPDAKPANIKKANVKWYTFNNNEKDKIDKPERFVFFKLEGDPTKSFNHLISAIGRYGLSSNTAHYVNSTNSSSNNKDNQNSNSITKKQKMKKRREDCDHEGNCNCIIGSNPNGCKVNDPKYLTFYTNSDSCQDANFGDFTIDTHTRVGDEFFVPSYISDTILDNIKQNPYNITSFKKCTPSGQKGGNRKSKKHTRKISRKNVKSTKHKKQNTRKLK